jgi:potassium uptake protein, TrkH family
MSNEARIPIKNKFAPVQVLAIGFALVILTGAVLLTLPVSSSEGHSTSFLTALFTSTSAVCVTGLVVVDTGTYWSVFGQVVIMLLIQTGGLGFMTFATFIALVLGRKVTLHERLIIQEALNSSTLQGMVKLVKYTLIATFTVEGIGALLLSIGFIPDYGVVKGLYFGLFHAVSAFCNAGFDIVGGFKNLMPYQESAIVSLTVCALIIIGGIGFIVQSEIVTVKKFKKFSLHTKVVLITTAILVFGGALIFLLLEYSNPETMQPLSVKGKLLTSLFASVTPRTAGFNTLDTTKMTQASKLLTIFLMYIGASPGSTGGGIKTSTFAVVLMAVISVIKGREDTEIMEKRIAKDIIYKAIAVVFLSMALISLDVFILSITEKGAQLIEMLYEATSAFGTVGLSLNFSPRLTSIGRVIIILTMYAGRVGPLSLVVALLNKQLKNNSPVKYPEDKVLIG